MSYNVKFVTYSGMSYLIREDATADEARAAVKDRLKRARRDKCPVSKIGDREWEIETPDDAFGISDTHGFLKVVRYVPDHVRYRRRRFA